MVISTHLPMEEDHTLEVRLFSLFVLLVVRCQQRDRVDVHDDYRWLTNQSVGVSQVVCSCM